MNDLFQQLQSYDKFQDKKFPTSGTIVRIDGGLIDVSIGTTILRNVKCVGVPTSAGEVVVLSWENSIPTAHVSNGSTPASNIAFVRGPQGLQGDKGDKGDKGDTGAQGPAGSLSTSSPVDVQELNATPAAPAAGYMRFYPKIDHKFYQLSSAGVEQLFGGEVAANGWISVAWSTPTRVSATDFTVNVDLSTILQKGDKLTFTDTTTKYLPVKSVTWNAGTGKTTISTYANSDYVLVGNPSAISYSKIENPQGWPHWFNYAVSWTAVTTNPVLGNGVLTGVFMARGKNIFAKVRLRCGTTTTYGTGLYSFSIPAASADYNGTDGATIESASGNLLAGGARYGLLAFIRSADMRGIYGNSILAQGAPVTLVSGNVINLACEYEAA